MASESIDIFDELGRHHGVLDRATAHAEGWWHQVFHVLIVANRPDGPSVVLQRRARHKATFPGLLDLSATGHLNAGESPFDGLRELREELGVDVAPSALVPLGVRRLVDETPEGMNREFCHVFLVVDDRPLAAYRPDPDEVSAVVEIDIDPLLDLVAGVVGSSAATEQPVGSGPHEITVELDQFVPEGSLGDVASPGMGGYWATVLTMADRLAKGEKRLAI